MRKTQTLPKLTKTAKLTNEFNSKKLDEISGKVSKPMFKLKKFLQVQTRTDHINQKYIDNSNDILRILMN